MSLFPFIDGNVQDSLRIEETQSIPREYAWDFQKNDFKMQDGKFIITEGLEAIQIWAYKALLTARFIYPAYSWEYGNELDSIVGNSNISSEALQSEVKRLIEETLSVNEHIKGVSNVQTSTNNELLSLSLNINTDYGEAIISV